MMICGLADASPQHELMAEDGVTLSAVLLFGRNPSRFLPQSGIDAASLPGTEKDYRGRASKSARTSRLMKRTSRTGRSGPGQQLFDFVRRNTGPRPRSRMGGRKERPPIRPQAIRESWSMP